MIPYVVQFFFKWPTQWIMKKEKEKTNQHLFKQEKLNNTKSKVKV
jgi:hypothetical protein